VFELYGSGSTAALRRIFRPRHGDLPERGRTRIGDLADGSGGAVDEALVSCVPAEAMWSGMDAWTLSVHGGLWIQRRTAELLEECRGKSLTTRGVLQSALEQGVLDAVQAAAYEFLVQARTERASHFFVRQHAGELSRRLSEALSVLDRGDVQGVLTILGELLRFHPQAYRLGHPLRLLIAGRPNSGKSTLFNRLLGEERAVVTSFPGTTRDMLEGLIAIGQYPVLLHDSAGLQPLDSVGPVEREGIEKVLGSTHDAIVYLVPPPWRILEEDRGFLDEIPPGRRLLLGSLSDLRRGEAASGLDGFLSGKTGDGLDALADSVLGRWIDDRESPQADVPPAAFTAKQARILRRASEAIDLDAIRSAFVEFLRLSWPEDD
jgi:tRNA modification GTPase